MPPDGSAVAELVTLDVKMFFNYGGGGHKLKQSWARDNFKALGHKQRTNYNATME